VELTNELLRLYCIATNARRRGETVTCGQEGGGPKPPRVLIAEAAGRGRCLTGSLLVISKWPWKRFCPKRDSEPNYKDNIDGGLDRAYRGSVHYEIEGEKLLPYSYPAPANLY